MNFRQNEIAFERAARSYYETLTDKSDWSAVSPELRAYYRDRLAKAANEVDEWITAEVERQDPAENTG